MCTTTMYNVHVLRVDVDYMYMYNSPSLACIFGISPACISPVSRLYLTVSLVSRGIPVSIYI